jgi:hypothetical protein
MGEDVREQSQPIENEEAARGEKDSRAYGSEFRSTLEDLNAVSGAV